MGTSALVESESQPSKSPALSPFELDPAQVEKVAKGVTLRLCQGGKIAAFKFCDPTPDALERWAARLLELDYNGGEHRQGTLIDVSYMEQTPSAYMRRRMVSVVKAMPNRPYNIAIVTTRSLLSRQLLHRALKREIEACRPDVQLRFFCDYHTASAWLHQAMCE